MIDARTEAEHTGAQKRSKRGGRVPAACHLKWTALVDSDGRFLDEATLRTKLPRAGVKPGEPVITHCQGGGRASVDAFVFERLGFPTRNYYLGWSDCGNVEDAPIETGPAAKAQPRQPVTDRGSGPGGASRLNALRPSSQPGRMRGPGEDHPRRIESAASEKDATRDGQPGGCDIMDLRHDGDDDRFDAVEQSHRRWPAAKADVSSGQRRDERVFARWVARASGRSQPAEDAARGPHRCDHRP